MRLAPAGSVALWLNLEAPATALLGWAFFKEHIGARTWGAAALTWGASVLLAGPSGAAGWQAAALVAAGCFCWGLDNNLTAVISSYTPAQTTFVKGVVAATVNLGVGAVQPGVAALSLGTSGALRVIRDRPGVDARCRTFSYALADGLWVVGGAVSNGAVVAQWAAEAFGS